MPRAWAQPLLELVHLLLSPGGHLRLLAARGRRAEDVRVARAGLVRLLRRRRPSRPPEVHAGRPVAAVLPGALDDLEHVGLVSVGPAALVVLAALRGPAQHAGVRPAHDVVLAVHAQRDREVAQQLAQQGQ